MRLIFKVLLLVFFVSVFQGTVFSQEQPDTVKTALTKKQYIRKYMNEIAKIQIDYFFKSFMKTMVKSTPEFRGSEIHTYFNDALSSFNYDEISEELYPIYDKYLDYETIKTVVDFYETPSGMKLNKANPKIFDDIFDASAKWSNILMTEIQKSVRNAPKISSNIDNSKTAKKYTLTPKRKLAEEMFKSDGRYETILAMYDNTLYDFGSRKGGEDVADRIKAKMSREDFLYGFLDAYANNLDEQTLSDFVKFSQSPESQKFIKIYNEKIKPEETLVAQKYGEKIFKPALEKFMENMQKRAIRNGTNNKCNQCNCNGGN